MNKALTGGVSLALLLTAIGPMVHLMKVIRVNYDVGTFMFYAGFPAVILLLLFGGLWQVWRSNVTPAPFLSLISMMLVAAGLMAFVYGGTAPDVVGNALRLTFVFLTILFLTNASGRFTGYIDRRLQALSKLSLGCSLLATVLMHGAALVGYSVYFGLQTTAALIPLAYGLIYQRMPFVILSLVALIGSGKRGGMLAGVVMLIVYVGLALGRVRLQRVVSLAAVLGLSFVLLYAFELLPQAIFARIDFLFSEGDVDLNVITSGRYLEVESALYALNRDPIAWLTGFGLGSAIEIAGVYDSTVHFSPLAMILIFGLPLTVTFYSVLIYYLFRFFTSIRKDKFPSGFAIAYLVVIAELAFSFTAFTILQSYSLWIFFAYLLVYQQAARTNGIPSQAAMPLMRRSGWSATTIGSIQ